MICQPCLGDTDSFSINCAKRTLGMCEDAASEQCGRMDFVFDKGPSCVVVVQITRNQHKYNCLHYKIAQVKATAIRRFLKGNHCHVLVVRFNPDAFHVDGKLRRVKKAARHQRVIGSIKEALEKSNLPECTWSIQHMYYDVQDGRECIKDDIDPKIAAMCRPPIT